MIHFNRPEQRPAWQALQALADAPAPHLRELLQNSSRNASLQFEAAGIQADASRQRVTPAVMQALLQLARERALPLRAVALEQLHLQDAQPSAHVPARYGARSLAEAAALAAATGQAPSAGWRGSGRRTPPSPSRDGSPWTPAPPPAPHPG